MKVSQPVRLGVLAAAISMSFLLLFATPKRYEIRGGGSQITEIKIQPFWGDGRKIPQGVAVSVYFAGLSPSVLAGDAIACISFGLAVWAFKSKNN